MMPKKKKNRTVRYIKKSILLKLKSKAEEVLLIYDNKVWLLQSFGCQIQQLDVLKNEALFLRFLAVIFSQTKSCYLTQSSLHSFDSRYTAIKNFRPKLNLDVWNWQLGNVTLNLGRSFISTAVEKY